jgi:hypothetical protein
LPNPSFNIVNQNNEWGSANRWGIWSNSIWQSGTTVRQVSGVGINRTFTYITYPGKLSRQFSNYSKVITPSSTPITLTCSWGCVTLASIQAWEAGNINDPKNTNSSTTYKYENGVLYLASDSNKTALVTSKQSGFYMNLTSNGVNYFYVAGPNNWQSFTGLQDSNQEYVTFSDPIDFTLPSTGDTLTFEGHGSITGIPTRVYTRDYVTRVDTELNYYDRFCQNDACRWVHNYLIDDEQVSINGATYFIQWLQANVIPAPFVGPTPSDIVFGNVNDLPSGELPTNVRQLIGEIPVLSSDSPIVVIEGVLAQ